MKIPYILILYPTSLSLHQKQQRTTNKDRTCPWSIPIHCNDRRKRISWNWVHRENPTRKRRKKKEDRSRKSAHLLFIQQKKKKKVNLIKIRPRIRSQFIEKESRLLKFINFLRYKISGRTIGPARCEINFRECFAPWRIETSGIWVHEGHRTACNRTKQRE